MMFASLRRSILPTIPLLISPRFHAPRLPLYLSAAMISSSSSSRSGPPQQHDETLVRPETANVPAFEKKTDDDGGGEPPELVFFNTFFCPYAQMAWIALNEKGIANRTEFVEGLTIRGGDYEVHPRLRELGRSGVPTLYHPASGTVVDGSTECVAFIDGHYGTPHQLLPENEQLRRKAQHCETLLHSRFTFQFYSMLLRQEPERQEKAKKELVEAVRQIVEDYQGPFYLGERFSCADIALAPYFDRMAVLEHYRDFVVPPSCPKWHEWCRAVLERPSVAATRQDRKRLIEAYRRYALCYVRNNWYERVFYQGY